MIIEAASKSSSSGGSYFFLIIILAFVLLYLIVLRPKQKRQTQARQQLSTLQVGDDVLTAGGVYGRVTRLAEDEVTVEIAPKVEVRVARRAIAAILTEHAEPQAAPDEPDDESGERWQSAFGEGSDEEKPG